MESKLRLEVFRFDAQCDYLPYYKKLTISIDTKQKISYLLKYIKDDEKVFEYPTGTNAAISINGVFVNTSEKLGSVVERFGKELTLEPLNQKRAIKDLVINDDDFEAKFDILEPFVDPSDRKIFQSYIQEHYASPIVNLDGDFQGDGLFCFAYDMIQKYPGRTQEILGAIAKQDGGIWLHVNINAKFFATDKNVEDKIVYLKNAIIKQEKPANQFVQTLQIQSENF